MPAWNPTKKCYPRALSLQEGPRPVLLLWLLEEVVVLCSRGRSQEQPFPFKTWASFTASGNCFTFLFFYGQALVFRRFCPSRSISVTKPKLIEKNKQTKKKQKCIIFKISVRKHSLGFISGQHVTLFYPNLKPWWEG